MLLIAGVGLTGCYGGDGHVTETDLAEEVGHILHAPFVECSEHSGYVGGEADHAFNHRCELGEGEPTTELLFAVEGAEWCFVPHPPDVAARFEQLPRCGHP